MRISSLGERREFYSHEFSLTRIRDWFRAWRSPIVFAVVIGRHTGISPMQYRRERARTIVIDEYESRSEEHTSELQSRPHLVCRLLLEKKKIPAISPRTPTCSAQGTHYPNRSTSPT